MSETQEVDFVIKQLVVPTRTLLIIGERLAAVEFGTKSEIGQIV